MNVKGLKLAGLLCLCVLLMLYVAEWVTAKLRPVAATVGTNLLTNAVSHIPSTNMTPSVRAGLMVALEHVRQEMTHTTNEVDLNALRAAETTLTNVLARP